MATYTRLTNTGAPTLWWGDETITSRTVNNSTTAVVTHGDGTRTVYTGTNLSFSGGVYSGTITSAAHQDGAGTVTFEQITNFSQTASSILGSASPESNALSFILSGADTLNGGAGDDVLVGFNGADTFNGGTGFNVMSGNAGNDFISGGTAAGPNDGNVAGYTAATAGVTATLTGALGSTTSSVTGNVSVGTDTLQNVEQIRGSSFADTFLATASFVGQFGTFNAFDGRGGDDTITGNGATRIVYSASLAAVTVTFTGGNSGTATSTAGGDAAGIGTDTFTGVNQVRGSNFNDTINAQNATGSLIFEGLGGDDTFRGGTRAINNFDFNRVSYLNSTGTGGVTVSLGSTSTVTGDSSVGTDTLIGIEGVRGSRFADTFTAGAGFSAQFGVGNYFEGAGGNDTITGNGSTRVDYFGATAAVTVNLQAGTATSTAGGDAAGIGTDTITGGVNGVTGSDFDDLIVGSDGAQAERLDGRLGNDTLDGGGGTLDSVDYRPSIGGVTVNLATGTASDGFGTTDTLIRIEGARGSEFNDTLIGDANANILGGQGGDDSISGGGGNDRLSGDEVTGANDAYGGAFGTAGIFDVGNDTLDGGAGADTMVGGLGNDTYFVDDAGDAIIENAGEGLETVNSTASYTLAVELENLVLTGSGNISGGGNGLDNIIVGNAGNNVIDGGAGSDTLQGGVGNDTYTVDSAFDSVVENANEGTDTVNSFVSYTLGANQENLTLFGSADLTAGGNGVGNQIIGNGGNNILDGGAGADTMFGGAGNDLYVVDDAGDLAAEGANGGIDTVNSFVSLSLGADLENLTLFGTGNLVAGGNGLGNQLVGNAGNNTLDGSTGADTMFGGLGDDVYVVDDSGDQAAEGANAGTDTVNSYASLSLGGNIENLTLFGGGNLIGGGNALNNVIIGNAGNNTLDGNTGADTMIGGLGNDTFVVDDAGDIVAEGAGEGTDTVNSYVGFSLGTNIENLTLLGGSSINGSGNGLGNFLIGNGAANILDGLAGQDTLSGGAGDDTFVFRRGQGAGDTILDFAGNGSAPGDSLQFVGYGLASQGATFTQVNGTQWSINSADGLVQEVITLANSAAIHPSDYVFV